MPLRGPGGVEPRPGLRAQRFVRVLQGTGRGDQPAGGQGQADVVVAVPHVELGRAQVLVGLPPVDVVVDGHLRVPVVDEVDLAILATAGRAVGRDPELPGEGEVGLAAGRKRLGQPQAHDRPVDLVTGSLAAFGREVGALGRHAAQLHAFDRPRHVGVVMRAGGENVVQQLDIDRLERVRGAVEVGHRALPGEPLGDRIELGLELVLGPLLPVLRPGRPVAGSGPPVHGELEALERGQHHGAGGGHPIGAPRRGRGRRGCGGGTAARAGRDKHEEDDRNETRHGRSEIGFTGPVPGADDVLTTDQGQVSVSPGHGGTTGAPRDRAARRGPARRGPRDTRG